ncbi:MAG: prepilin-type N-terminal cleavage/methylation domain-containing protein [Candidatus Hydrogenedentes bacterium]|nr:prepilin-type N-terminal cleavage/methylation domain-containing protein [Candidatus Hydrogenedentota bacterium]
MEKQHIHRGNAGLTMIELMITAAIFSSSMVLLSGTLITFASHNTISEQKAVTSSFNRSVFEDMRGRGIVGILSYEVPSDNPENGTVFIPGMGEAKVSVWAVLPQNDSGQTDQTQSAAYDRWFLVGVEDPSTVVDPPNPIEIVVQVFKASGLEGQYYEGGPNFRSSTMIGY